MLSIKQRQIHLKYLGMYNGKIDGIEGPATRKGYRTLQNKYFIRKSDRDGIYGRNTEVLLIDAYRVKKYTKNFKLEEFRCECGGKWCTGYPAILKVNTLKYLQSIRNKYGPMTITSGLRCIRFNSAIGGIRGSKHTTGDAFDLYCSYFGKSLANRKKAIDWIIKFKNVHYCYGNGYARYKFRKEYPHVPTMGKAIHYNT